MLHGSTDKHLKVAESLFTPAYQFTITAENDEEK
jgi:hypothetical protein